MGDPVIIDYLRTPFGKRDGALRDIHPARLLGNLQGRILERNALSSSDVDIAVGGCVTMVGEQGFNITRIAWLDQRLDPSVGAFTIDAACGSSQQAAHQICSLIATGEIKAGLACGVESLSRVPIGASTLNGPGRVKPAGFPDILPSQFRAAERIAEARGLQTDALNAFALRSHTKAKAASHKLDLVNIELPDGTLFRADEGVRDSTLEALEALPRIRPYGRHTAATASQLSDGASTLLIADKAWAESRGFMPRGRLVQRVLTGADPWLHIEGPIDATRVLLKKSGRTIADFDHFEINEAFSCVPLAWLQEFDADPERLNPWGGAIAVGHPMGASGLRLIGTALSALEDNDGAAALIAMCCGSAVATGTILERLG
ncbi:MAG: acetyl-CoA C-acyltransferase [Paracoccaceae bacterium]|nr:acetyl-CoA C-acyltransferase [Paracoccaceae bacterium]